MPFERVGHITVGYVTLFGSSIDSSGGFVYFGSYSGGSVIKIRISDFTKVNEVLTVPNLSGAVIDLTNNFLYLSADLAGANGDVVKLNLSDFSTYYTLDVQNSAVGNNKGMTIDIGNDFLYASHILGMIRKIRLSTFSLVSTLVYSSFSSVIDTINGFLYLGFINEIYKIDLSTFTYVSTLTVSGAGNFLSSIIDVNNQLAYFNSDVGKIIKIDLSNFSNAGEISGLEAGECYAVAIDTVNNYLYSSRDDETLSKIYKVNLNTFTVEDTLTLLAEDNLFIGGMEIDLLSSPIMLYAGMYNATQRVIKINTNELPILLSSQYGGGSSSGFKQDKNILAYMQRLKQSQSKRK